MASTTILILSVSAGAGHVRAAEALRATAQVEFPNVNAVHINVMDLVPEHFRKLYSESYVKIVDRHPAIWGYFYHKLDMKKPETVLDRFRRAVERVNTRKLNDALQAINPDYVICTHFLPADLLAQMRKKYSFYRPVWVQITDFTVHTAWVHHNLSGYFVASDEVAWRLRDRGVDPSQIHVTGISIMPAFRQKLDRVMCAREIGIDPGKFTLLMMSGGLGIGGIDRLAERLLQIPGDLQVVALAGKNQELLDSLHQLAKQYPGKLFPMGFTQTIERVMAAADIAVTKPGGLTTSECLAMGLPMIVVSPIPGQEERNAEYLLEQGAALKAYDAAGMEFKVRQIIAHPERLEELKRRCLAIGKPDAATAVLRKVLNN